MKQEADKADRQTLHVNSEALRRQLIKKRETRVLQPGKGEK